MYIYIYISTVKYFHRLNYIHTPANVTFKVLEVGWEMLHHSPYSSDLAYSSFILFVLPVHSLVDPMNRILRRSICVSLMSCDGAERLLYSWIYKASVIMGKICVVGGRIILEIEMPTFL
jgi:hypothetical protein